MVGKQSRIIVGLSGGVDSAVCALTLLRQGYHIEAVFMQNWEAEGDPYCTAEQDLTDARSVCDHLHIPFSTVNFARTYWDEVFEYCLDQYAKGKTPNPDVLCNTKIKFQAFLDDAIRQGADYIATGHYAQKYYDGEQYYLMKGQDVEKDQSYFLHGLNQAQLGASLFPIGKWSKATVRQLAREAGLFNCDKPDSTGICFIGERRFKTFLQSYLLNQPGPIQDKNGRYLGQHDGLMFYTIGQRKGLGIGGQRHGKPDPWYVIDKQLKSNALIVTQGNQASDLLSTHLYCDRMHWINAPAPHLPLICEAKIRYRQAMQACVISQTATSDRYRVDFKDPQRAITPGQYVVFYQGQYCLGGASILGTVVKE